MKPALRTKPPRRNRAFTLIELLTVIAIIALIAGLLLAGINGAITKSKQAKAREAVHQMAGAMRAYYTEFGCWPINAGSCSFASGSGYIDCYIASNNGGTNFFDNTSGVVFYTPSNKEISTNDATTGALYLGGRYVIIDPWKHAYKCRLDTSYTGTLPNPFGGATINQGFAVWSDGADGITDSAAGDYAGKNADNARSW